MSNNPTARKYALDYFTGCGWSPAQAAGIVANLECESGLRANAVGDGGLAYGIAQWHPDRQENFAQILGKPIRGSSLADQLAFVHAELQSTEKRAGNALSACTNARESGALISRMYERPADQEGEARKRGELAQQIFQDQPQPAAPIDDRSTILPQPEKPMGALALLQLFGPILSGLIPQIAPLLGAKGDKITQYAGVAKTVLDTITATTGAPNLQGAVEAMAADPAVKQAVQKSIVTHEDIIGFLEVGGGVAAARTSSLAMQNADKPFWYNPAFWISMLLLVFPMMLCIDAFYVHPDAYAENLRTQIVTGILAVIMIVGGFWLGTSFGSQRKTELNAVADRPVL